MLGRLLSVPHVARGVNTKCWPTIGKGKSNNLQLNNIISKRWSGHNAMEIKPSTAEWGYLKNWTHFYMLLGLIPVGVITTIINIRANPELSEVPDGYEPRHWEYFKHPISRFVARYMLVHAEREEEAFMGLFEYNAELNLMKKISMRVEKVMGFYNDHRSKYFSPQFADYFRTGREHGLAGVPFEASELGLYYDMAYDPEVSVVPTEGYLDGPLE